MTDEVKAVVDVHEPDEIGNALLFHDDVDGVAIDQPLETADIIVNGIGFERKTPSDYASSLVSSRLKGQVNAMAETFDAAYILLEGDIGDFETLTHSQIPSQSLRGSVASFAAREGVPTVFCGDLDTLVDMAVRIGRKHSEAPSQIVLPSPDVDDAPVGVRMWATLPHVGPELAQRLYSRFGAPTCLVGSWTKNKEKLQEVEGIGEKTASDIANAMVDQPDVKAKETEI